jgi:hypothetical protein
VKWLFFPFAANWAPQVRIAFLQSLISFLGTKQENLCWTVLRDAVSNPIYVLDSALFALLAVHPANPWVIPLSDVQVAYIADPDILTEMAQSPIPHQCHESYAKDVLYSISQLPFVVSVSSLGLSEREARKVRERLSQLQHSAYRAIFSCFLTASNAYAFAQRGLDGAKSVALSDEQGVDLFPYFVYGIGVCVALDPRCWEVLCQLVDFLAELVDNPRREPTKASLKAIQRLNAMQLRSNMVFQSPNSVREQLTVDRMSLLEPITRRGCDHFTVTFWERRFRLFTFERRRVSSESPTEVFPSELAEARSLLLELIHLYGSLQYDLAQFKSKITSLFDTASAPVADILTKDSLSGSHGLDGVWINELRLQVLSWRVHKTLDYARSLAAFQTQVSTYHNSFYAQHWGKINKLLVSALTADSAQNTTQEGLAAILLDPMFDRVPSSPLDLHILDRLLDKLPDVVIRHRPQWVIERTYTMLSALQPLDVSSSTPRLALLAALRPALLLVEYVNTVSTQEDSAAQTKLSAFSPLAALLIEAIYAGNMRNFNLARSTRSSAQRPEPVLMYPYFVTSQHDESGGDIESRGSKAIVPQLLDRYEQWKTTHASQYLSDVHQPQILPSALAIIQEVLASSPKLVLVHPSLFLSFAVVTFGEPYIETSTKIDKVVHHLKSVLKPNRERESGTRWGWAPPLSLTLSFARVLFTETANEVAEAIMDDYADIGSQTCKLAALELLEWWTKTFYGESLSEDLAQLVKSMEKGEGKEGLMREYDELRVLACRDESKVAREKAFVLPPSASLCEKR